MALPLLAREAREQHAQVVRPATAAGERKSFDVGWDRAFRWSLRRLHNAKYRGHEHHRCPPRLRRADRSPARQLSRRNARPRRQRLRRLRGRGRPLADGGAFQRDKPDEANCARWSRSRSAMRRPPRCASSRWHRPIGWRRASPACKPVRAGRFLVHGAHDRAGVKPNDSESRSRPRSPSAPATTAPRAAVCWRSTIWRSAARAAHPRHRHRLGRAGDRGGEISAPSVVASDIDRVAVAAARGNARLNRAGPAITLRAAPPASRRAHHARKRLTI